MADTSITDDRIAERFESLVDLDTATNAEIIDILPLELTQSENFSCPPSLPEFPNCTDTIFNIQEDVPKQIDLKNLINYHCLKYNLSRSAINSLLNILHVSKNNPDLEIPKNHNHLNKGMPEISIETFFLCGCSNHFKDKNVRCNECNQTPHNIFSIPNISSQFNRVIQKIGVSSLSFAFFYRWG